MLVYIIKEDDDDEDETFVVPLFRLRRYQIKISSIHHSRGGKINGKTLLRFSLAPNHSANPFDYLSYYSHSYSLKPALVWMWNVRAVKEEGTKNAKLFTVYWWNVLSFQHPLSHCRNKGETLCSTNLGGAGGGESILSTIHSQFVWRWIWVDEKT